MPKRPKRFSDNIMLRIRIDHVYDFGSIRSKIIVISCGASGTGVRFSLSGLNALRAPQTQMGKHILATAEKPTNFMI